MTFMDTSHDYYTFKGTYGELLEYTRTQDGPLARFWEIFILFSLVRDPEAIEKLEESEHLFVDEWYSHLLLLKENFLNIEGLDTKKYAEKYNQKFILAVMYRKWFNNTYFKDRDLGLEYMRKSYDLSKEIGCYAYMIINHLAKALDLIDHEGKSDESLEFIEKSEKMAIDHQLDFMHVLVIDWYGWHYTHLREYDKAIEFFERAYKIAHQRKYIWQIGDSAGGLLSIYRLKGMLNKSLEFALEKLELEKNSVHRIRETIAFIDAASLYALLGDHDQALVFYEKGLEICEKEEFLTATASTLLFIGRLLKMRDESEKALDQFERAYQLWQEEGNPMRVHLGLSPLINLLSTADREKAKDYLDRLEKLERENRDKITDITSDLKNARAIYLKNSLRLRDKMQAQVLYEEIFQENNGTRS